MIEELAVVTSVEAHEVSVESEIKSTCHGCEQSQNCASGQIAKALPKKQLNLVIETDLKLNVGDKVVIALPQNSLLSAAWQTYLWPILGIMLFSGLATVYFSEPLVIAASLLGGLLGFKLAKFNQQRLAKQNGGWLEPRIVRKACDSIPIKTV